MHINLQAQTDQVGAIGIGAVSDDTTVSVTIGQPFVTTGQPLDTTNIGFANFVDDRRDSMMCYNIGEIPDITVTPSIKTRFAFSWKNHENAGYSFKPSLYPDGTPDIKISPSGSYMVFEYNPDPENVESFQVEFKAGKSGDTVKQTVTFNPVTVFPSEFKTIPYLYTSKLMDSVIVYKKDSIIDVIGNNVVFDGERPFSTNGSTINKLSIYAVNLTIRNKINLPGCDLTVYCENLTFEGDAYLNIQPDKASNTKGINAKNMHIYAKNYTAPGNAFRFYVSGGEGEGEILGLKNAMGGGDAGNFTTNLDLERYVNLEGGCTGVQINRDSIPTGTKGKNGEYKKESSQFAWLHPITVRFELQNATDYFIYGQEDSVYKSCEKYINLIDALKRKDEDVDADTIRSLDLDQLYYSFAVMRDKLAGGYDYFGNPKSWAPLLSFESNKDMYSQEINYAIRVLYLHYWITNISKDIKSTKEAADSLLKKNLTKINELKALYDKSRVNYPDHLNAFTNNTRKLIDLNNQYQKKVDSLLALASKQVAHKNRWRGWVYNSSLSLPFLIGCPGLGFIITPMVQGAAQFDYNDPWTTDNWEITQVALKQSLDDGMEQASLAAGIYKGDAKLIIDGSSSILKDAIADLSPKKIKEKNDLFKNMLMPADEVTSKFNQLKANCPQIEGLTDSMELYAKIKAKSWEELMYTIIRLNNTSDEINQLLIAGHALNKIVKANENIIDARALSLLDEMKKDAWANLLKYHYYMAKAFHYRFLKPYPFDIKMQNFFQKIESIAKSRTSKDSSLLSPTVYDALKIVFEDPIKQIADSLFNNYNAQNFKVKGKNEEITYELTKVELKELNSSGTVNINLWESGMLRKNYFDIRFSDIDFDKKALEIGADTILSNANLKILIEHSGYSNFIDFETGNHYVFNQLGNTINTNDGSPIFWGLTYHFYNKHTTPITMSVADKSLIKDLLNDGDPKDEDILIFSQPAAWANLKITKDLSTGNEQKNMKDEIKKLILIFKIDYKDNNNKFSNVLVSVNNDLMPVIECDKADVNGLTAGRGNFTRTFKHVGQVKFTAPKSYGNYEFIRWVRTTNNNNTDSLTDPIIQLNVDDNNYWITAKYKLAVPSLNVPDTLWTDWNSTIAAVNIKNDNFSNDIVMDWSVSENSDWLSIASNKEGIENGTSSLQLSENSGQQRKTVLNVFSPNAIKPFDKVVVIQRAKALPNIINNLTGENYTIRLHPRMLVFQALNTVNLYITLL